MLIIGIAGKKQSGKDTIASIVKELYYKDAVTQVNFADALKEEVCQALKITRDELEKNKKHYRLILQGWGTDYRRELFGDTYWITRWKNSIYHASKHKELLICSDVRFHNEYQAILDLQGVVWRVTRKGLEGQQQADNHLSETNLDQHQFSHTFQNDGTIDDLKQQVKLVLMQALSAHNDRIQKKH